MKQIIDKTIDKYMQVVLYHYKNNNIDAISMVYSLLHTFK